MKKIIVTLIIMGMLNSVHSQNNGVAAAAGVAALAGILVGISVDNYIEELELRATEYVLSTRPEVNQFILENLKLNTTKGGDKSDSAYIPFGLTYYIDGQSFQELVIMTCSNGWITQAGLNYSKISFETMSKEVVSQMFFTYINMGSPIKFSSEEEIKEIRDNQPPIKLISSFDQVSKGNRNYYLSKENYRIFRLIFAFDGVRAKVGGSVKKIIEFRNFGDNAYKVSELDTNFKVVYNKYSIGLFHIENGELTKINHSTLNRINEFFVN